MGRSLNSVDLNDFGERICILGRSCGGKSTLAHALGKQLDIPVLHLDQIAHLPHTNWERRDHDEFVAEHDAFLRNDQWIIEGNYSATMPQRLERATSVIFIDLSFHDYIWRYLKRSIQAHFKPQSRMGAIKGAKKEFNWDMIKYVWLAHSQNRLKYHDLLAQHMQGKPVIVLTKFSQLHNLYKSLGLKLTK
jgi:adenylate kinase family enzyme